jgi:chitin synthase
MTIPDNILDEKDMYDNPRAADLRRARYLTTEIDTEIEDESLKKRDIKSPPPTTWTLTTWILTFWAPPFMLKAAGMSDI